MILVFGKTGQLARELAVQDGVRCLGRAQADLSDPAACAAVISEMRPEAVINAAAYTAVDKAEAEEALAHVINAAAPAAMAQACASLGIPFVTLSTDYVFDGSGTAAWRSDDRPAPLNAYGRSKLAGEAAVVAAGGSFAVLRTSWVVSAHGHNFIKTMLRLGAERARLTIVADQIGAPTPARDIATTCLEVARQLASDPAKAGIYHYGGTPAISWAGFAEAIFARAGIPCEVAGIPTSEYPTPAQRPLNSRLDSALLETFFGISPPDWQRGLDMILNDLGATT